MNYYFVSGRIREILVHWNITFQYHLLQLLYRWLICWLFSSGLDRTIISLFRGGKVTSGSLGLSLWFFEVAIVNVISLYLFGWLFIFGISLVQLSSAGPGLEFWLWGSEFVLFLVFLGRASAFRGFWWHWPLCKIDKNLIIITKFMLSH